MAKGFKFDSNMLLLVMLWEVYDHVSVMLETSKPEDDGTFGRTLSGKVPTSNEEISFLKSVVFSFFKIQYTVKSCHTATWA